MIPPGLRPCGIGMRQQQGWDQSTGLHSDRDYHFFALRLKCVTPAVWSTIWINFKEF